MSTTSSRTSVATHPEFRSHLRAELVSRIQRNPRYSVCAFARSLDIDKSTLSKLMNGKRPIGQNAIVRLGTKLQLQTPLIQRYVEAEKNNREKRVKFREKERYQQLQLDSFHVISDWYHYALLELMRVDHFKHDVEWAAQALGISPAETRAAIERLCRLGMMEITPTGKWVDLTEGRSTTIGLKFTDQALRKMQHQVLAMAQQALETTPIEERDQTAMTFAADSARIAEAKQRITVFRRELARFLSRGETRDRVYHLSLSLYPVSARK